VPQALYYLAAEPDDTPLVAHIYGSDPEVMADAAEVIEGLGRFAFIDVNCGCPVRKIQRKGAGVALMREPEKIGAIVRAMTDRVSLPVTVKTRLGLTPDQYNIETVARIAQDAGAAALFIHARVASAKHAGPPDWPFLRRIKEQCKIPVIGNGGVTSPEEADALLESSGVDGVMIGRGAVGSPWLFKAITAHWNNQPYESPSPEEQLEVVEHHLRLLQKHVSRENEYRRKQHVSAERVTCLRFRAHLARYMRGYPGWRDLMREFNQLDSIEEALEQIRRVLLQE
jgi:nifR3 family TIM-barrel protein